MELNFDALEEGTLAWDDATSRGSGGKVLTTARRSLPDAALVQPL
jgi:hypothetical protein